MRTSDRSLALSSTWASLWWLIDPARRRWTLTFEVLADTSTRVTIERGSGDTLGRRAIGTHSDPTLAAAAAAIDVGIDGQRQARTLRRTEATITETAAWLRATIAGDPVAWRGGGTLATAAADTVWCQTIPHSAAAWRTDDDQLRHEFDHAIDHLERQAKLLVGQCRAILATAVNEKPNITQPRVDACRAHQAWAQDMHRPDRHLPAATKAGACEQCAAYRAAHGSLPHPPIIDAWDRGVRRLTPALIAQAKSYWRTRRRRRTG